MVRKIVLLIIWAFCCQGILAQDVVQEGDIQKDSLVKDSVKKVTVCLENEAVKRFLDEVSYEPESESQIGNYLNILNVRGDLPRAVVLPVPFFSDSTFSVKRDTLLKASVDTIISLQRDTLLQVKKYFFRDSLSLSDSIKVVKDSLSLSDSIKVVKDSIIVDSVFTTTLDTLIRYRHSQEVSVKLDTMVVVPQDTLWLSIAADSLFTVADTMAVVNGERPDWTIYNLIPQRTYYYRMWKKVEKEAKDSLLMPKDSLTTLTDSLLEAGEIHTEGRIRMIYAPSIRNIRDFGGWITTDSLRVKYGLLYRGGELNGKSNADSIDVERLKQIGIKAEIDMRYDGEVEGTGVSVFGFKDASEVGIDEQPSFLFTNNSGCCELSHLKLYYWQQRYRKEFEFIVNCLRNDMPVYYHCIWGTDRTGMLSILMGGLLGVSYSDLMKDFELSSFYAPRSKNERDFIFDYINGMGGNTMKDRFYFFFRSVLGVSSANIDYFREVMLEEIAETETEEEEPQKPVETQFSSVKNQQNDETVKYDLKGIPAQGGRQIVVEKGNLLLSE